MARHIHDILWEDREQREYRAAKARFFRLLSVLILLAFALILLLL
jgi:hypothetical protein